MARRGPRQVHAVLLHGAAGTGKLDLALDTAEALLCERRVQDGSPCGRCPGCTLVAAGNHPDLRIVRPEALAEADSRIGQAPGEEPAEGAPAGAPAEARGRASRGIRIEQIRDLSEWITLSTHRGGARVIVIEPAESMNTPASNALLKVLEEPPARTLFLLVSHRVDETLPTLRSRCALLRVRLPAPAIALGWLQQQGVARPAVPRSWRRRPSAADSPPSCAIGCSPCCARAPGWRRRRWSPRCRATFRLPVRSLCFNAGDGTF